MNSKNSLTLLAFVLATGMMLAACQPNSPQVESQPAAAPTETSQMLEETVAGSQEVSASTQYQTPGGTEDVSFTIVVDEAGVIADAQTTVLAKNPTSVMRQKSFAEAFPAALKGKSLSELANIDRVGGSSLTTAAFNEALSGLQAQL